MKHAREDYDRFQDPAGLIPEDEPVVLLRGQDSLAVRALEYYAELCEDNQAPDIAAKVKEHVALMKQWPKKKIPDLPTDDKELATDAVNPLARYRSAMMYIFSCDVDDPDNKIMVVRDVEPFLDAEYDCEVWPQEFMVANPQCISYDSVCTVRILRR